MARIRADQLLVDRGLAQTIEEAGRLIMAGRARTPSRTLVQPGTLLPPREPVEVVEARRFVSRGGEKLAAGLDAFGIDPAGLHCLDLGASTGGFSDCLLQRGAARVVAVDVGRGLLHSRLRADSRVTLMEGTNARELPDLPGVEFFVADLAFIGLQTVLSEVARRVPEHTPGVVLLKPQFEGRRDEVPADGVVRDPSMRQRILDRFQSWLDEQAWSCHGVATSPLAGDKGNVEQLVHVETPGQGHRC